MSCFICGRGACMPSFHSSEEQEAFAPADEAYDRFIEIRDQCRAEWTDCDDAQVDYDEGADITDGATDDEK